MNTYMLSLVLSSVSLTSGPDIITLYITDPHTLLGSYSDIVHDILIVVIPTSVTVTVGKGGTPEQKYNQILSYHYSAL